MRLVATSSLAMIAVATAASAGSPPQMTVPGQFGVSATGASGYSIPIQVPPGTAGMVPAVSLNYSSERGDGIVGWGFSLGIGVRSRDPSQSQGLNLNESPTGSSVINPNGTQSVSEPAGGGIAGKGQTTSGLPTITRCAKTIAQDGTHGGVHYDSNDRFCLNGERLVVASGTYGANLSEYRTEIDDFTKVIAHGTAGVGPAWFEVHQRNGITLEFGNTADSQILAVGSTTARAWALNKAKDSKTNYFTITYIDDVTNGQFYPTQIDYTGNTTANVTPYNSVQFVYNTSRPDTVPMYQGGSLQKTTVLLTDIKTFQGGNLVFDYKLAYRMGSSTLHSRLTSVTQCDSSGTNCLAPTSFTWQGGTGLGTLTSFTTPSNFGTMYSIVGDFNGDGWLDDNGALSSTCGIGGIRFGTASPSVYTDMSASLTVTDQFGNILPGCIYFPMAGTATADLSGKVATGLEVAFSATSMAAIFTNDGLGNFHGYSPPPYDESIAGDLNGDGRKDLISLQLTSSTPYFYWPNGLPGLYPANYVPLLVNGAGTYTVDSAHAFAEVVPIGSPWPYLYKHNIYSTTADFEGSGCADLLFTYHTVDPTGNNGGPPGGGPIPGTEGTAIVSGCGAPMVDVPSIFLGSGIDQHFYKYDDFNGDGKTDVAGSNGYIYLSTGNGFVQSSALPSDCVYGGITTAETIGDVNGDGRGDLLCGAPAPNTTMTIYLSTGSGFVAGGTITNSNGISIAPDLNGDGVPDFIDITAYPAQAYTFGYTPELVTGISDGIGATTTIAYDRLNKNSPFYTRATSATYPTQDYDGAMYVVSQVQSSNGVDTINPFTKTYTYAGLKRDLNGRGNLGFTTVTETDQRTGLVTTSNYSTAFPTIGFLTSQSVVTTASSPNCTAGVTLRLVTNTPGVVPLPQTASQFVFTAQTAVTQTHECDGTTLPTVTTVYHFDCQDGVSGCYGQLKTATVSVSDGSSKLTTFSGFVNDTTGWCFDEPQTIAEQRVVGSSNMTRTTTHTYSTCLETQQVLEPSSSTMKVQTNTTRDAFGNPTITTVSGSLFTARTTTLVYDSMGEFVTQSKDTYNHTTNYTYNSRFGGVTSQIDPNSAETDWTYDSFGRVSQETRPDDTIIKRSYAYCSGFNGGSATCIADGRFQEQSEGFAPNGTTQNGPIATATYDMLGRTLDADSQGFDGGSPSCVPIIRVSTRYEAKGHVSQTSRPYFSTKTTCSSNTARWTVFSTYDALDRALLTTYPDASTSTVSYHGSGNLGLETSSTNACGQLTKTNRNARGMISSVKDALEFATPAGGTACPNSTATAADPGNHTTTYVYDAFNDLKSVTDPKGNVTTNSWDLRGHKLTTSDPDMGIWTYTYDGLGNLKTQVDAVGNTATLNYDLENRLTLRTEQTAAGATDLSTTWVYGTNATNHNVDKLTSACTGVSCTASSNLTYRKFTYDSASRVASTRITSGGTNYTYTPTYNATNGQLASVTYPSGLVLNYGYTALSYQLSLTDAATTTVYWTATARDAELHLTKTTAGNGVLTVQGFDAQTGRLTSVTAGSSNSVANFSYVYDSAGNLISRTDSIQGLFEAFCYDPLNRLTSTGVLYGVGTPGCSSGTAYTVAYDSLGDIVSRTEAGSANAYTYSYSYPATGQPRPHAVSSIATSAGDTINGVANPTFGYDANGNMTSGLGRTVTPTSYNMLAGIETSAAKVCLTYDDQHARIVQVTGTSGSCAGGVTTPTTTTYLNDPVSGALNEKKVVSGSTSTWNDYIVADGHFVAVRTLVGSTATMRYFTLDHLGSVAVVTDSTGSGNSSNSERDSYDAWGKHRNIDGSDDVACSIPAALLNSRGFTNQEEIHSQCLVNLNARVYDPAIGRFMTADDIIPDLYNPQALNRYTYVENGPLSYTDPTGHFGADSEDHLSSGPGAYSQSASPAPYTPELERVNTITYVSWDAKGNMSVRIELNQAHNDSKTTDSGIQQTVKGEVASPSEYSRVSPESISKYENDPLVTAAEHRMQNTRPFTNDDPRQRYEKGIWYYTRDSDGEGHVEWMPRPKYDRDLGVARSIGDVPPPTVPGYTARLTVHDHPFPLSGNLHAPPQPSRGDINYANKYGLPGKVVSHDGDFYYEPHQ